MSLIRLKRSNVSGKVPLLTDLELGELAINTFDGSIFLKKNQSGLESIVEFYAKVPIKNTIFLQKNGLDTNSGDSWDRAVASFEKALELAAARNNEITLIDVGPGIYTTQGHLDVPDNTAIRSAHRTAFVVPQAGYEERNVFRLGSGCFIEGLVFENWRLDDLDNPTEGFAVCFRPGAVITRAPYVHKVVVRTPPYWGVVAPPLDRANSNPLIGRGAGVVLADGAVCSPYSVFPNIMTWGATPVTHNGIGYCAKNGALINAVNAISIWPHKHFYAIDGGQIILSSCSTQFGDYTMVSKGIRELILPTEVNEGILTIQTAAANAVTSSANTIINNMWIDLDTTINPNTGNVYTAGWNSEDELYTKRDGATFMQSMVWVLQTANEKPMLDFAKGLFNYNAIPVFSADKKDAFIRSFEFMRDQINLLPGVNSASQNIVSALVTALNTTLNNPVKVKEPSVITAVGHTWTAIMAGVALTKIPPARNQAKIQESILELNQGVVIASGQDDQGSALFIGGMEIDADTGELSGPPFERAVNRVATRISIARSF